MAFLTEDDLKQRASSVRMRGFQKNASELLNESVRSFNTYKTYDVFLSHSFKDADIILGLKDYLETVLKLTVYVDWIDDKQLDRSKVNRETADLLRKRMSRCKSLFYAVSINSQESRWMPWELGYFDGLKNGKVAIVPIAKNSNDLFTGEEYLQLYQTVQIENNPDLGYKAYIEHKGNDIKKWIE